MQINNSKTLLWVDLNFIAFQETSMVRQVITIVLSHYMIHIAVKIIVKKSICKCDIILKYYLLTFPNIHIAMRWYYHNHTVRKRML